MLPPPSCFSFYPQVREFKERKVKEFFSVDPKDKEVASIKEKLLRKRGKHDTISPAEKAALPQTDTTTTTTTNATR